MTHGGQGLSLRTRIRTSITSTKGPDQEKRRLNRQIANRRETCMLESPSGLPSLLFIFHRPKKIIENTKNPNKQKTKTKTK